MNELQIFNNEEFGSVRTIEIDGEPWFVGKDIANALDYKNSTVALQDNVDAEDKGVTKVSTLGGMQEMTIINESGLYSMVFGSRLPNAKKFKHWVTSEVLPTIRKTGGYNLPQTYSEALRALADKAEEAERLALENAEMKPKADYFDALVDRKLNTCIRDTAKELGIGEKRFIAFLTGKYVYRDSNNKLKPYAAYTTTDNKLFVVREYKAKNSDHAGIQTLITPKGRETFRLLLCSEENGG